ncbi:MAG: hypothetical protein FJ297_06105 [Planctomycetes bacterium]|nr:hypothetical protein [Planctomycetota bacterium]
MGSWSLHPVFGSYLVVAGSAAGLAALLWLRPAFGSLTRRRRAALLALRGAMIGLLVLALLRPALVLDSTARQTASVIVLFDASRSMGLPDATSGRSRWDAQLAALRSAEGPLAELAKELDVKVYAYDRGLHPIAWTGGTLGWPDRADGVETDIGTSLDQAVRREIGRRVAACFLFGDGVQTAFYPEVEIHEAGRELARLGAPLFAVPFGKAGAEDQSRDVAVESLPEQYTVFAKNQLQVKGVVRARGFANQPIPAELIIESRDGGRRVIGPKEVVVREDGQQVAVVFDHTPETPGQYKVTLRVPEQPGELVTKNNALTAFLTVLEGGLKVAYLYGSLLGEQRALRWSLESSPDIDMRYVFLDPRNRARWPDDLGGLLRDPAVDVFLIENVDASAFRNDDLSALAKSIENGRGFMMIGGHHSFGPAGYFATPLNDPLPVELGRLERQDASPLAPISGDLHWDPPQGLAMIPTVPHPITRLADGGENDAVWRRLPPLTGANRLPRIKAAARVLAETPEHAPLLVAGEYGQGRTLAFAGDSTRRWWQHGHQAEHKRFWRQAILWLARREDDRRDQVWVRLPQRRYPPNAAMVAEAGARSPSGDPITDASVSATLAAPDGTQRDVRFAKRDADWQSELGGLTAPGDYELRVTATAGGKTLGEARAVFQIVDQDLELTAAAADPDQLARLAVLTRDLGGRVVAPEELAALLAELKAKLPADRLEIQRRWRLGDTAWDAWLFFLLVTGLLSAEWYFRKRWGLA